MRKLVHTIQTRRCLLCARGFVKVFHKEIIESVTLEIRKKANIARFDGIEVDFLFPCG